MYKVEIIFNSKDLTQSDMDQICEETDQIFEVVQTGNREKEYILTVDENRIMVDFGRQSLQ